MSSIADFPTFFKAIWGYGPFPWQTMLAERITGGCWPSAVDLPTATGKTACIDAAIYALACQADKPIAERTAPRRIWFVVDRRIVVDEAYERAKIIARNLAEAEEGPLKNIADQLRRISGTKWPLATARLRGGILYDDSWARLPSQPAVITSTVDQVGSRLLFRGYGKSHLSAPIFAGLVANDSLILLDEAHCSVPFLQTLRSIERYRGEDWAEKPLRTPFSFVILSATPPSEIPSEDVFPGGERKRALDHPVLLDRLRASKPARLVSVKAKKTKMEDPLPSQAAERAVTYILKEARKRVAVIVNRVWSAEETARIARELVQDEADVLLLTGRIRPYERDRFLDSWKATLRASDPIEPRRPILLVSTQCIEVGADLSFDALVTEAASLDALRQRFGRLNRMGFPGSSPATIIVREEEVKAGRPDYLYGTSLKKTWTLLNERASMVGSDTAEERIIDFGIEALEALLADIEDLSPYLIPKPEAPFLLPAHLDLLCQTAPVPYPDPDVQLFLHGKQQSEPEARVLWRADLQEEDTESWNETVALCPPLSGELLSVPLYRLRKWLVGLDISDNTGDVEGVAPSMSEVDLDRSTRPFLRWRGRDRSKVCLNASDILPNEVIVLPTTYGIKGIGQSVPAEAMGKNALDIWEPVRKASGLPAVIRLHQAVLQPWLDSPLLRELISLAVNPDWDRTTLLEGIGAVLDNRSLSDDDSTALPDWIVDLLINARLGRFENHPSGGVVLFARDNQWTQNVHEDPLFADDDDLTSVFSRDLSLSVHSASVERAVEKLVTRCLPNEFMNPLRIAACWHDAGKLDERFQAMLRNGDELAVLTGEALAKSAFVPTSPARRREIRTQTGLPPRFRKEMLSIHLAERYGSLPKDEMSELVIQIIASHHGHARPLAPISPDPNPPPVLGYLNDRTIDLSSDERKSLTPSHRYDSGLAERFWRLNQRYGWWGLAYLEAIFRLGDWYGSRVVLQADEDAGGMS